MRFSPARALYACVGVVVLFFLACGGKTDGPQAKSAAEAASALAAKKNLPIFLRGYIITTLGDRTMGPFFARRPDNKAGLVAWVTAAEGSGRRIITVPTTGDGEPNGPEKTIANIPVDATMLVVKTLRGPAPGFVVAWTALTDRGEALWAMAVGDDGAARGKAVELARTTDDIVWVDVVPTDLGAVLVWAEETRGADANVLAAGIDTDGKLRGVATRVARGVTGWHVLEVPGGVGLSLVSAPAASTTAPVRPKGGLLSHQKLDPEGRPNGAPMPVITRPVVSGDVEVVRRGNGLVFAWTDRTGDEPSVAGTAIDDKGTVEPPKKIAEARGGASLLGLATGAAGVALMWESPARRGPNDPRSVHVAKITAAPVALETLPVTVEAWGRATPEMQATQTGFAVVLPARDCDKAAAKCLELPPVPAFVRLDERGTLIQRENFAFGSDPAQMAWNLACGGDNCFALAASGPAPSRIRTAAVSPRANVPRNSRPTTPGTSPIAPNDARIVDVTAVASGESVADIAIAKLGDSALLAMLTHKPEAQRDKGDAKAIGHTLTTRFVDANGTPSAPSPISNRALAVGGVAIAAAGQPDDGAAVAWVAREGGDPEVHVTRVDKKGKKTNDVQLTTTKGDASDVAIAWAGNGWIVAWIDGRDGNGEVYATKVSIDLARIAREERITNAPGDASDLVALGRGDHVWLAWADPRESPRDGMADIWTTAVKKHDAKRAFDESRVLATAAHSRTPQLVGQGDNVHVAWIEEAPLGTSAAEEAGYGALWVALDAKGKPAHKPVHLPTGGPGAATAVAIEAFGGGVRGVVARSTTDAIALDTFEVPMGAAARASPLLTLDGPPSLDVALVLDGGHLYFNDDGPNVADKRARRARIAWTR